MDVYLVPVGPDGYELYCEPHPDLADASAGEAASAGVERGELAAWRRKLSTGFRRVLTYLEQERERRAARRARRYRGTPIQRMRDRVVAWLAERVAEQRLLWRLRSADTAVARYPDDMTGDEARAVVQRSLQRDGARHRNWLVFDAIGCAVAVPVSFVPGPNLLLYYFIFRLVGHYLSWRGARHGLDAVVWRFAACAPLADLRRLPSLPKTERAALAHGVAERLGLEHIDTFADRMVLPGA